MTIDLRSDTITRPTREMKKFMFEGPVGDDVFSEDPSVNELEKKCADIFGKDCGLFCPSGTMTNQIALNILTKPYEEIICYEGAHIYKYEGGGVAGNSLLSFKLLKGNRGKISVDEIKEAINSDDQHFPDTSVIEIENTVNKGGGSTYSLDEIAPIKSLADKHSLKMHLDGARIFNAITKTGEDAREYGKLFDTISMCLSKGLGAPVGSVLVFDKPLERMARRRRKTFGGAMRQAGYLAAAGIYALDHHVKLLVEDHKRAEELKNVLIKQSYVESVLPVDTNIVIFKLTENLHAEAVLQKFNEKGLLAIPLGPREIRFVTHLDFIDKHLNEAVQIIKNVKI